MVVIAGLTVSSADNAHHHGFYLQRKHWSSSRVKPSAAQTKVVIAGYTVISIHHGRPRWLNSQSSSQVTNIPTAPKTMVVTRAKSSSALS
ncbi:hypothetical protein DPMN_150249 [Dreissena polymorpha]|uniref:Uncharacterized protein n=1 Tax=Dreissena polymorpha TaxID=45954 RepID=A0A9D4FHM0_DREPO|nr:hypothetical protein DPMN_150249 [Dreissena polymorpha]